LGKTCLDHLNALINHFGRPSKTRPRGEGEEGERVEALINGNRLMVQLPYFVDAICKWVDGPQEVVEMGEMGEAAASEDEGVVLVESGDDDSGSEWEPEGEESDDKYSVCSDDGGEWEPVGEEEGESAPKKKPWWQAGPSETQRFWRDTARSPVGSSISEWLLLAKLASLWCRGRWRRSGCSRL
jgi:hypothetical protein